MSARRDRCVRPLTVPPYDTLVEFRRKAACMCALPFFVRRRLSTIVRDSPSAGETSIDMQLGLVLGDGGI